jgi:signal transduction histidine kinase
VAVFFHGSTEQIFLGGREIAGIPIRAIFFDRRIELAHMSDGGGEFEVQHVVDIDPIIRVLLGHIEICFDRHLPGLQAVMETLAGEIQVPLGGADGIEGIVGGHAMVRLMPANVIGTGVDGHDHVGPVGADDFRDLLDQVQWIRILEHAVVKLEPMDILLRNAQGLARIFFLGFADGGEALAGHVRIVGALVVVGVNKDVNIILAASEQGQGAGAAERVVVRVRGEQENCFFLQFFELNRLRREQRGGEQEEKNKRRLHCRRPESIIPRMPLDNRTLIVSALLVTAVLSLLDILIWRTRNTFPGFGRWAVAHALFAPTLLLFSLRSILTDWWTMALANTMAVFVTILVLEAAREFRGLRPRVWQAYAGGTCGLATIFYFRYVENSLNVRVLVAAATMGVIGLLAAKVLLTDVPADQKVGMRYTGWLMVVCASLQIARGVYIFMQPDITDLFAPTRLNAGAFVGMALGFTGIAFGFLVMTGERLMSELRNSERQTAKANFELIRLRRGLETAVIERTAELRETQQALTHSQNLESLGRLAGGVAHDFNNFLTVIRGYSRMLAQRLDASSPLRDDVAQMSAACEQATILTRQLLAFSRRQGLEPSVMDLNQVIGDMAKMLALLIGEDIEVVIATSATEARVKADLGQMHQVILNLFLNARDAMPRGGKLKIETSDTELTEADARRLPDAVTGRYVMLSIRDGGTGMDEETRSHLFEPFFTTKPAGQGTGLGLATVYGIVKQSGGHIELETAPGKGATFRILLPLTTEEIKVPVESISGEDPAAPAARSHARILIVDDAAAIRTVLRRVLERAGYEVIDAADVNAALGLLQSGHVDVVLTDVQMPGRSGVELAELVIRDFPGIKVIAMSGFEGTYLSQLPRELGISSAVTKPMQPEELIGAVRAALA